MQRRIFLASLASLPFVGQTRAATPEWEARLITRGIDENSPTLGLHVKLAKGWKTYWRVPGEAGIPPQIKIEGSGITTTKILYPLPQRLIDDSGESIGYHDEVVFILQPSFADGAARKPLQGKLNAFLGVCQIICKPVKFEASLASAVADEQLFDRFMMQVPKQAQFVSTAEQSDKLLELALTDQVHDIFIDGPDTLYFRKPELNGKTARLKIDGLDEGQNLKGEKLRIIASVNGKGLEQTVVIS